MVMQVWLGLHLSEYVYFVNGIDHAVNILLPPSSVWMQLGMIGLNKCWRSTEPLIVMMQARFLFSKKLE